MGSPKKRERAASPSWPLAYSQPSNPTASAAELCSPATCSALRLQLGPPVLHVLSVRVDSIFMHNMLGDVLAAQYTPKEGSSQSQGLPQCNN